MILCHCGECGANDDRRIFIFMTIIHRGSLPIDILKQQIILKLKP